jgi:8-oxo-dGTP pyrophosphatase MutT (NUDIX family)
VTPPDERLRQRLQPVPVAWPAGAARRAAVLAPIVAQPGGDAVLFVVRAASLRLHPGQIGFPGGSDAGDTDPATCALRETHEEIGVSSDRVVLLGALAQRTSSSAFEVQCLVGRLLDAQLLLQHGEVERALLVPLAELAVATRWQHLARPPLPPSPHFDWHGDVIWGLTGRFAWDLVQLLA